MVSIHSNAWAVITWGIAQAPTRAVCGLRHGSLSTVCRSPSMQELAGILPSIKQSRPSTRSARQKGAGRTARHASWGITQQPGGHCRLSKAVRVQAHVCALRSRHAPQPLCRGGGTRAADSRQLDNMAMAKRVHNPTATGGPNVACTFTSRTTRSFAYHHTQPQPPHSTSAALHLAGARVPCMLCYVATPGESIPRWAVAGNGSCSHGHSRSNVRSFGATDTSLSAKGAGSAVAAAAAGMHTACVRAR